MFEWTNFQLDASHAQQILRSHHLSTWFCADAEGRSLWWSEQHKELLATTTCKNWLTDWPPEFTLHPPKTYRNHQQIFKVRRIVLQNSQTHHVVDKYGILLRHCCLVVDHIVHKLRNAAEAGPPCLVMRTSGNRGLELSELRTCDP